MVHIGKNTRSRIVSKGISAGHSRNVYRGLVQVQSSAQGARNYSQCDSMLIGDTAGANTYPYIQVYPSSLWLLAAQPPNLHLDVMQGMYGWIASMQVIHLPSGFLLLSPSTLIKTSRKECIDG